MTDQLRISDSGEIEVQPLTEDGEPLYSPSTMRELFSSEAFQQMRGQTSMPTCKKCGAVAVLPVGTPDLCQKCSDDAWKRIETTSAGKVSTPANNVWD